MEINDLPTNAAPTSDLKIELSDGTKATLASLPAADSVTTLLAGKQPLDSDLTAYANAPDAAARRALISAETSGAAAAAQAFAIQRANHTGTQSADTLTDGTTNKAFLATERTKLAAISGTNTGDQTALTVPNTPAGGIAATTVQAAINELDTEKAPLASPTFTGTVSGITKSMVGLGNVDNTSDANKPVSTAQQTALNLKADLASPTFTGDPKAPTPAVTDDDTSIATTAFVQDVQQAGYTQPTAIAITAAGNSNVAAATAQNRYLTQRINVTAFTGTATVTLQSASAIAGDKRRFIVSMPAGLSNNIELRNLTSGGTLLATVPMDGALARTWLGYSTFDGTNWGSVSFSPLSVDELVLARTLARMDYIQSDGATSNRAPGGIYGPFDASNNPREWIAGVSTLTIPIVFTVPTSNPVTNPAMIVVYGPASTWSNVSFTTLEALIQTDGSLQIVQAGISSRSNNRYLNYAGFRAAYSGQTIFLKFTATQGTTNPVIEVNGVNISASFTLFTNGTPPAWLDAAMVPTYRLVGYNWPSGPAPIVTPILGTTTAADDAFYLSTGKWPAWVVAGGSCASVTAGSFVARTVYLITAISTTDFTLIGAASNTVGLQFTATGVGTGTGTAQRAGALSLPSVQPINVVDDVSGIGGNQGRILGGTPITASTNWRISANTWTSGNQQILAGSILDSTKHIIDQVEQSTSGTPTTTIGSASAGAQYKASSALTAGINPATLVTRKLASNDVWVNSNSTAVVRTTITGHIAT